MNHWFAYMSYNVLIAGSVLFAWLLFWARNTSSCAWWLFLSLYSGNIPGRFVGPPGIPKIKPGLIACKASTLPIVIFFQTFCMVSYKLELLTSPNRHGIFLQNSFNSTSLHTTNCPFRNIALSDTKKPQKLYFSLSFRLRKIDN